MSDSSDSEPPLASDIVCDEAANSRNQRRQENKQKLKSLPKVFWIYDATLHIILGAALFTNCLPCASSDQQVSWELSRVCLLTEYRKITSSDRKYFSSAFELTGSVELELRLAKAKVGGTINNHFVDFVGASWKCICFDQVACGILKEDSKGKLVYVKTSLSLCGTLGIHPSKEQSSEAVMQGILELAEDGDADIEAGQVPRFQVIPKVSLY